MRRTRRSAAAHRWISTDGRISPARPREPCDRYRVNRVIATALLQSQPGVASAGHSDDTATRSLSCDGRGVVGECFVARLSENLERAGIQGSADGYRGTVFRVRGPGVRRDSRSSGCGA